MFAKLLGQHRTWWYGEPGQGRELTNLHCVDQAPGTLQYLTQSVLTTQWGRCHLPLFTNMKLWHRQEKQLAVVTLLSDTSTQINQLFNSRLAPFKEQKSQKRCLAESGVLSQPENLSNIMQSRQKKRQQSQNTVLLEGTQHGRQTTENPFQMLPA